MGSTMEDVRESGEPQDETTIRAAFEAAMLEDRRPLARIAPETGVAYPTLSAWRNGTYTGNNKRITAQVQSWLASRAAHQRTSASLPQAPAFVMTRTASRIWEVLEFAQTLPDLAVIAGGAGIGKTSAAHGYRHQAPNVWICTMEPCHTTVSSALGAIAATLDIGWSNGAAQTSEAIKRRLKNSRGLLIVDEAQHLPPAALDQVRSIHDLAQVGIVFMGNETVFGRFGADRRTPQFAQLFSRIGQRFKRDRPLKADIDALMTAWNLTDDAVRHFVQGIAQMPGGARGMTKALRMAFGLAGVEGLAQPSVDHIQAAWSAIGESTGVTK